MLRIKEVREKAGLTQKELAELSDLNPRWIRKLECGEISIENITIMNMAKLLKGLYEATDDEFVLDDFLAVKSAYIVVKNLIEN